MNEETEPQQGEQEQAPAPRHYTIKCLPGIFRMEQIPPVEQADPGKQADQTTEE